MQPSTAHTNQQLDRGKQPANTPPPQSTGKPSPRKHSPDGATRADIRLQLTTHLSTPKVWKAELAYLADLQRMIYPHNWSLIRCRSSAGQGKVAGQRLTFYNCATPPTKQYQAVISIHVMIKFSRQKKSALDCPQNSDRFRDACMACMLLYHSV